MLENCRVVDLSHELHEQVPTWLGDCGFKTHIDKDYEEIGCRVMSFQSEAGIGTHMDAPSHFKPGCADISDLPVQNFVTPLCVLKVTSDVEEEDVLAHEEEHGTIQEGSLVIANTGWARYWTDRERYIGFDESGGRTFPGYSVKSVELLLKRGIVGIGIDTLSPDSSSSDFPVHHLLLSQGKYILENVANLEKVPPRGAWAITLPMKIQGASEAPCRCIALVP